MKKVKIFILAIVCLISLAVAVWGVSYDSGEDPLVSLSYIVDIFKPQVDKAISSAEDGLRAEIEALNKKIDAMVEEGVDGTESYDGYEVLFLSQGEKILAETQCEFILRVGSAHVVSPYENQGIADLTEGTDLAGGASIAKNHLLLVPRGGDGRGVVVTSESAYIMVRGEYSIGK